MLRICRTCKVEYDGDPGSTLCPSCSQATSRERRMISLRRNPRICGACGSTYLPASGSQKYCSDCIPRVAGAMSSDQTIARICRLYLEGYSMHRIAQQLKLSDQKVRRTLIQYGLYTNSTIDSVLQLHADGLPVEEIAAELGLGRKAVISMLPYDKGAYGLKAPSQNAAYLRLLRNKEE